MQKMLPAAFRCHKISTPQWVSNTAACCRDDYKLLPPEFLIEDKKKLFNFISDFYFIQSDSDGFILFLRSHGASVEWMNEWSDDQQVCLSETDISPLSNSHSLDMMSWFKAMITEHTSYIHLVWSVNKSTDHILSFMMDLPVANRLIWFNSRESNKHKFGFKLTTSVRR